MTLLERDGLLAQLEALWRDAARGPGRLVFVEGEAGIGKTTLLRAFARQLEGRALLGWGACEAMLTPVPLSALDDMARQCPHTRLARLARTGAERAQLFSAFVDWLAEAPIVLVIEDVHWADQATLDLLRHAGRRIGGTRSLVVASLRSDELGRMHPLRAVLGDLATSGIVRLAVPPLSPDGVRSLCARAGVEGVDSGVLHRETAGNPFFVTEVLACAAAPGVPRTVQDAVLARAGRLSASARAVLDAAAVAGPRIDPGLLHALTAAESGSIDECLATGVLHAVSGAYEFRHELARQAILAAQTPTRTASLHRMALQALLSDAAPSHAAARLAAHAEGAGDPDAVRHWAPMAAREAAARGAHREAAAQWARALCHLGAVPERAAALDDQAVELLLSAGPLAAMPSRREAADLWRLLGVPDRAAASLVELVLLQIQCGRNAEAAHLLQEARSLEHLRASPSGIRPGGGPAGSPEHLRAAPFGIRPEGGPAGSCAAPATGVLARVDACAAWLCVHDGRHDEALTLANAALAEAERRGDRATLALSVRVLGHSLLARGEEEAGITRLQQCLDLAIQAGDDRGIAQGLASLAFACKSALRLQRCEDHLQRGMEFCTDRDLDAPRMYLLSTRAHLRLLQCRWDEADRAATLVLEAPQATALARFLALLALARLRARRGDAGAWRVLDEARTLAATGSVQMKLSCQRTSAEVAWLEGRDGEAAREAAEALAQAIELGLPESAADLALWCRRGGQARPVPDCGMSHPAMLEAAGRWQEAAAAWRDAGCLFEAARALADGDEAAQREALATFERLGARPMIERVRHQLRSAGVRGLKRGPRASTQSHPAGLTSAEVQVLSQLGAGLRSKQIAALLHRSPRTVDHHLQAIFAKLGVATRAEAVAAAIRLGVAPVSGRR